MGITRAFKPEEIPHGFKPFTWEKPKGTQNCDNAKSIRSIETGYTAVKIGLRPDEIERIKETGEVYLVLCTPHSYPIPPFWVGANQSDAIKLADDEIS